MGGRRVDGPKAGEDSGPEGHRQVQGGLGGAAHAPRPPTAGRPPGSGGRWGAWRSPLSNGVRGSHARQLAAQTSSSVRTRGFGPVFLRCDSLADLYLMYCGHEWGLLVEKQWPRAVSGVTPERGSALTGHLGRGGAVGAVGRRLGSGHGCDSRRLPGTGVGFI